jgi:HSP20 family molecular chaperone IbpA
MTHTSQQPQTIPLQVHQANDRLVLAAPMPRLEPQDIAVIISGNRVTIPAANTVARARISQKS